MDMSRRNLLSAAIAAAVMPTLPAAAGARIRAVAFDGIALFDPRPVEAIARDLLGEKAAPLMALWRTRQFEYTWLRTVMNRYADFAQVTAESLAFAATTLAIDLDETARQRLVRAFFDLRAWPDVRPALEALRRLGYRTAIVSNFTDAMLQDAIRNSDVASLIDATLSTDRAKAYKPDPRAYAMSLEALSLSREEICFVAFAGWDASGAKAFGHPVYWANRAGGAVEELGNRPDYIAKDLTRLAPTLQSG